MVDIVPDGAPVETPELGAAQAYESIPATFGQMLGEQAGSTIASIGRIAAQGQYEGSGFFPQLLYGGMNALASAAEAQAGVPEQPMPAAGSVPSPTLSPADYNERFAPTGNDGKPVSLGSEPMPEGVARLIGKAKHDEIERENVTARLESAHHWPTNFAAGAVGFMLDPLRASTAFVPGIGEEAIAARLGGGIAARIAGRLLAGGAAGAAAQAPLSALEYGLGQEEDSDYGLRDAFRDMAFAAAGNAIFHAGVGTATELLRGAAKLLHGRPAAAVPEVPATAEAPVRAPEPPAEALPAEAAPILSADAPTQHAAISSAIGEVAEGRPVEVEPLFQLKTPEPIEVGGRTLHFLPPPPTRYRPAEVAAQQKELQAEGFAPGIPQDELREATGNVYAPPPEAEVIESGAPPEPETSEASAEKQPEVDPELAAAQQRAQALLGSMTEPEERAELDAAHQGISLAEARSAAYDEAASCLKESGI